jgi:hypothetical protein
MSNIANISCSIGVSDPDAKLGLEIWVDDQCLLDSPAINSAAALSFDLPDDDAEHELRFVMKNKTFDHTELDADGNIVRDARITISNLKFDQIELGQIVTRQAVYTHNFNGTQEETNEKFYGEMGCNGTVSIKFTTPIYLWLLENM